MTDDTVAPAPERAQHDPVVREERVIDARGDAGMPWRAQDLLARWLERGRIGLEQFAAAEDFRRTFRLAQLDQMRASDPARLPIPGKSPVEGWRVERARRQIGEVMNRLEPREGSILWHVVGLEWSLRRWCEMRRGHPADPVGVEAARGILIAALRNLSSG